VIPGAFGAGPPRVDHEQVPRPRFGQAAGRRGDFGRRDHDHFRRRDRRRPDTAALADLHGCAGKETDARDLIGVPPFTDPDEGLTEETTGRVL